MRRTVAGLAGIVAAATAASFATAHAGDPPLSPAQIALFQTEHLKDIAKPVVLDYAFHHHGGPTADFDDTVTADIREIHDDGGKDVWIDFLTGEHHVNFPPALGFHGNPLLMFFLEHDVVEMRDATGGAAQFFRNHVRNAFVDRAEMHPVEITFDGQARSATEITLTPFRNDPAPARFPTFVEKTYRFVLCEAIPGRLYQISTSLPAADGAPGAFEESITFRGEHDETH
jgi:hypothetical protein